MSKQHPLFGSIDKCVLVMQYYKQQRRTIMAKKGSKKTADKVPQTPNDVKPEVVSDEVETKIVNPVYQKFLNTLSSSEASVFSEQPLKGIPSFRKFLENLSDEELYELVK